MLSLNYPLNAQIEVTEGCNHRCFYCYNNQTYNKKFGSMANEDAKKIVEILDSDIHPFQITITGGEPLLNLEGTIALMSNLRNKDIDYNLNTNITLLNEETLFKLESASNGMKFGILASLPHYKIMKYEKITKSQDLMVFYNNLKMIVEKKYPLTINMVLHQLNKEDIYEEGKFLYENYGVENFTATPMLEPSLRNSDNMSLNHEEIRNALRELMRLNRELKLNIDSLETIPRCLIPEELRYNNLGIFYRACSAGRTTISICYDGGVRACGHDPDTHGNMLKEDFKNIWAQLQSFRDNKNIPQECLECEELVSCNGGCRYNGYKPGDELNKRDSRMTGKIKRLENRTVLLRIDENKRYQINKNTKYRKENEDIYTFFNGDFQNVLFINEGFKDFILSLRGRNIFSFQDLNLDKFKNKARGMLEILLTKNYLQEVK